MEKASLFRLQLTAVEGSLLICFSWLNGHDSLHDPMNGFYNLGIFHGNLGPEKSDQLRYVKNKALSPISTTCLADFKEALLGEKQLTADTVRLYMSIMSAGLRI